ncbi:hypothetical protein DERP_011818 [Dermatophagoides pteronyssinus]|uniref:Uncharacterized protein n=1 Tax=Dermatophagoides pteronyssinus TaxID=6956 RepID=A0ABQ8JR49_DERPT|nr:hypothetical protein DERP_011818 [Dermatophagoides pteronyssinus]
MPLNLIDSKFIYAQFQFLFHFNSSYSANNNFKKNLFHSQIDEKENFPFLRYPKKQNLIRLNNWNIKWLSFFKTNLVTKVAI